MFRLPVPRLTGDDLRVGSRRSSIKILRGVGMTSGKMMEPHSLTRASHETEALLGRRTCTADGKSAGASGVLEAPVKIGGPSRTRTLDPLIKSHFGRGGIGHHRAESAAIMWVGSGFVVSMLRVS